MKKLISLVLVLLVLLNTLGYYLLFVGISYRNDVVMTRQLDAFKVEDTNTITIKIPIAVPYLSDDSDYVRVDGKYEHQGEFYRMFKQKYAQDTLYIVCIKDNENKRIHGAMSDYVKSFAEHPVDQQSNAKLILTFNKDYIQHRLELKTSTTGWVADVIKQSPGKNLIPAYSSDILRPPDRG